MPSARIDQAKRLLEALGLPSAQRNDNAAYTLLSFAAIGPKTAWSQASAPRLTPHGVIQFAAARYGKV